ncbi:MAG: type II secretion system F family protein [Burkholderiaceae bacterium]|nr:type II secretion system F family protein [Burkholderiaceae bacterium]
MSGWLLLSLAAIFVAIVALLAALASAWTGPLPPELVPASALPPLWRPAWPLVRRLAPTAGKRMSAVQRERLRDALSRAGLDRAVAPEQLLAAQVVAGAAAGGFVLLAAWLGGVHVGWLAAPAAVLGAMLPRIALRDRAARRRHAILRQLPHDLDLITLAVEAGLNLGAALGQAAQHGPPGPLRDEWQRVLRDVRAGQPRHEALHALAARLALPAVSSVVAALLAAERQGASLAPILRAQAEQRRTERFLRAERLAMEAPVKMLFPLVVCIFPGTFAILLFPVVHQLLREGVL